MGVFTRSPARVAATVQEIMPATGLAFLEGDDERGWAVTKSTPGIGLAALRPGQRLELTLLEHEDFTVVSGYAPLD